MTEIDVLFGLYIAGAAYMLESAIHVSSRTHTILGRWGATGAMLVGLVLLSLALKVMIVAM